LDWLLLFPTARHERDAARGRLFCRSAPDTLGGGDYSTPNSPVEVLRDGRGSVGAGAGVVTRGVTAEELGGVASVDERRRGFDAV
jgi:hypothetical protein